MRDAGRHKCVSQGFARRDPQTAIVHVGALALFGSEQLVARRIVNDAGDELALALQTDRDSKHRIGMQEVRRAVEWIDDPAMRRVGADHFAALFHQEAVARTCLGKLLENDVLGLVVGGGHEIGRTFDRDLQLLDLAEIADEAAPGLSRRRNHDVEGR